MTESLKQKCLEASGSDTAYDDASVKKIVEIN